MNFIETKHATYKNSNTRYKSTSKAKITTNVMAACIVWSLSVCEGFYTSVTICK